MTQNSLIPLSPSETEILRIVWELKKCTVQEVWHSLPAGRDIAYATVQTLLRRLEKKGYLTQGKAHVFEPFVHKKEVISTAVSSFLDRLFGGDPVPLMQYLAENKEITREDIEKLRNILDSNESNS